MSSALPGGGSRALIGAVKKLPLFDEQISKAGRIDLFWRGILIAEHKSRGKDLDKAYIRSYPN